MILLLNLLLQLPPQTGHEPMDLIQIVDLSGYLSDGEFKTRFGYAGARRQQLTYMIYTSGLRKPGVSTQG